MRDPMPLPRANEASDLELQVWNDKTSKIVEGLWQHFHRRVLLVAVGSTTLGILIGGTLSWLLGI